MHPHRAQAPGAQLLPALFLLPLLLGAGPQGGCLASPVPAAPLPAPGPCAAQPCRNGGVCTPLSVAGQEHPAADVETGYSCTCPAGVSGTDCQVSGHYCRLESQPLFGGWGFCTPDTSFCYFRKGILRCSLGASLQMRLGCPPQLPGNASQGSWGVSCALGPGSHPILDTRGSVIHRQVARPSGEAQT